MVTSQERVSDTPIQFSTPVTASSPELQTLFDRIALGAAERDRDRILPFDEIELIRRSRLGALRIPITEGARVALYGNCLRSSFGWAMQTPTLLTFCGIISL